MRRLLIYNSSGGRAIALVMEQSVLYGSILCVLTLLCARLSTGEGKHIHTVVLIP